jgi:glycosyltransferase involved in cell wall biosynthesis
MKIGIDTFACNGGLSAVGGYLLEFLRRLSPLTCDFELFGWDVDRFVYTSAAPSLNYISQCAVSGKLACSLWHLTNYPRFARSHYFRACFFPAAHLLSPVRSPCPTIGTVHSLANIPVTALIKRKIPAELKNLDRVIAVSSFLKEQLADAGIKEEKIVVIPNGVDTTLFYPRSRREGETLLIQPFSFRRPYILYAARLEYPAKNHLKLLSAFEIFKEKTRYPHRLVLAGKNGEGCDRIKEAAGTSKYRNDIFFTGFFPSRSLPELYANADMVVIPSKSEGFGMGALEALASGVPLACSRTGSLPEAGGDAALYFDPDDPVEIAASMAKIASDRDFARSFREKGPARASAFSWETCVEKTTRAILEIAD